MRPITVLLATLVASLAFAQAEDARLRSEITAMLARWDKASMAADVKTQMAMLTPDFHQIDLDGKVEGRAVVKGHLEAVAKNFHVIKIHHRLDHLQPTSGDEAVAWVTMSVEFKNKKTGVVGKFTGRFAETARRVNGTWMFASSQALP
jgi:ketosteroid isomerase-like protein